MSEMRATPKTSLFLTGCHSFAAGGLGIWWQRANSGFELFALTEHRELAG
jgi:hypothetical protein